MRIAGKWISAACLSVALLAGSGAASALAASPQGAAAAPATAQAKQSYTLPEYNAFQAANGEKDHQARIKALDDLIAKYPASELADLQQYIYTDYYQDYYALKNYAQTIAYLDKLLALGDKIAPMRLQALVARAQVFNAGSSDKTMQTPEQFTKARDTAAQGLQALSTFQKPANATDDQFAQQKKTIGILFNSTAGVANAGLKDYKAAVDSYKAALAVDPAASDATAALTHYHLGLAYLQMTPPDAPSGYWELARAIALKVPGDAQVRAYLSNQLLHYQQPGCTKLVDDETNQLVTLAAAGGDRPATLNIPSADDLKKAQDDTANFIPWLQEGGDHGKTMWMATCGLEYPDVAVRVMEVAPADGDNVTLKVFRAATEEEMQAATAPNMEVHVVGQADAKRIQKDDYVRFTGTVTGYSQSPFLLTWEMAKVNAEDISPEKPAPGAKRPAHTLPPKK
jgi:tetratricopeptide (TPR) repeat protein